VIVQEEKKERGCLATWYIPAMQGIQPERTADSDRIVWRQYFVVGFAERRVNAALTVLLVVASLHFGHLVYV
jgi:hypothetical protein